MFRWKWLLGTGLLIVSLTAAVVVLVRSSSDLGADMEYPTESLRIKTTWNGLPIPEEDQVDIKLTLQKDYLLIDVLNATFYNDPELDDRIDNPGTNTTLYNYEVVEVFLIGEDQHYLEIELGPRGQYYVLQLHGERNVTRAPIDIHKYQVTNKNDGFWSARAWIQKDILPEKIQTLNAYAIHGSGENRVYLQLYPAPTNSPDYPKPDFHKLELAKPTKLFQKS